MMRLISSTGLAVALSLGAIGAFSTPASAQDIELRLGPDGPRPMIRDRDRDYDRRAAA
jgi:hypothetical protein